MRLMAAQKLHVSAVGAKLPVEYIADDGNDAERAVEQHIARHAQEDPIRRAHPLRAPDDVAGYDSADRVADARYETDHAIEPETDIGPRNVETVVHQPGEKGEVRIVAPRGNWWPVIVLHRLSRALARILKESAIFTEHAAVRRVPRPKGKAVSALARLGARPKALLPGRGNHEYSMNETSTFRQKLVLIVVV